MAGTQFNPEGNEPYWLACSEFVCFFWLPQKRTSHSGGLGKLVWFLFIEQLMGQGNKQKNWVKFWFLRRVVSLFPERKCRNHWLRVLWQEAKLIDWQ